MIINMGCKCGKRPISTSQSSTGLSRQRSSILSQRSTANLISGSSVRRRLSSGRSESVAELRSKAKAKTKLSMIPCLMEFLLYGDENGMDIFILLLKKVPDYKEVFQLSNKSESEIKNEERIQKHITDLNNFVRKIIINMGKKEALKKISTEIQEFHNNTGIPASTFVEYKNTLIDYMLANKMIRRRDFPLWHNALDSVVEGMETEEQRERRINQKINFRS